MKKRYLIKEYNWAYNDNWSDRTGFEIKCEFESEKEARATRASLERNFWRDKEFYRYRDDIELESIKDTVEELNNLTLGSINRPLVKNFEVYWYRDLKIPIELNDNELLYFLDQLGVSAYQIVEFNNEPRFFAIYKRAEGEYLETFEAPIVTVIGESLDELKNSAKHSDLRCYFELDNFEFYLEYKKNGSIPTGLRGSIESLSETPVLLQKLIQTHPLIKYNENDQLLGIQEPGDNEDIIPDDYVVDCVFSLNELLKEPVFDVVTLGTKELDEIRTRLECKWNPSANRLSVPVDKDKLYEYAQKATRSLEFSGILDSLPVTLTEVLEHVNTDKVYRCDLSNNGIDEFPTEISVLTKLSKLSLNGNNIKTVPSMICNFAGLGQLNLNDNNIESLPDCIENLEILSRFSASGNQLDKFPIITTLVTLNVSNNRIAYLPDSFGNLKRLEHLNLSGNPVERFPDSFIDLNFNVLILDAHAIKHLPKPTHEPQRVSDFHIVGTVDKTALSDCIDALFNLELFKIRVTSANFAYLLLGVNWPMRSHQRPIDISFEGSGLVELPELIHPNSLVKSLNISNNQLVELPRSIENFSELIYFDASSNKLKNIPDTFGNLTRLLRCDISNNSLEKLPPSISNFDHILELDISNNKLKELPESIGLLKHPKEIDLSGNQISKLTASIGSLNHLEKLDLSHNMLTELPDSIGLLENLEELNLSNNQLTALPDSIGQLKSLKKLILDNNEVESITESLGNLDNLEELSIANNQLKLLPSSIGKIKWLSVFNLSDNLLNCLPESFPELEFLHDLNLSGNNLSSLAVTFRNLRLLEILNLENNNFSESPAVLSTMPMLSNVKLDGNLFAIHP